MEEASALWAAQRKRLSVCRHLGVLDTRPISRLPIPPEKTVDPSVRDLAVHDAIFSQGALPEEAEFLQDAAGCGVAGVGFGLDSV